MNHSIKSRIVAALLVGLSATTVGYAAEPAISTVKPTAVEATEDTNDAAATAAPVETVEPDAANSVAYIDNAPIKAVKIDTKIKVGWPNKWQLPSLVIPYNFGKQLAKMKDPCLV